MDKAQLVKELNARYDANRMLVARATRERAAGFLDNVDRRHGQPRVSAVAAEMRPAA